MNGIERISQKILDEAREQAEQLVRKAEARAAYTLAQGREAAQEEAAAIAQAGALRVQSLADRARLNAGLEAKKIIAGHKQQLIAQAFDQALEHLLALPADAYRALLASLATQACADGQGGELMLNARDRAAYGQAVLEDVRGKLPGLDLTLSGDCAGIRGGVVIRRGKVEINCDLEVIVRMLREDMAAQVAACLFGKGA